MKIFQEMFESILKDSLVDLSKLEEDLEINLEKYIEKLPDLIPEFVDKAAEIIRPTLLRTAPGMLKEHAELRKGFENRLYERWGKAFDLLEQLVVIAAESGEEFNKEYRPEAAKNNDYVFEVITNLHARACQVSYEVLALLKTGYADGAMARWRCLQEITVTAFFIATSGQEVAERYLLHEVIESCRAAKQYQDYAERLGYPPYSDEEISKFEEHRDELAKRFGENFKKNYGWAAETLGNANPNFSNIEKHVDFDHLRPFYKMASHNVHANPKGIKFRLGLHKDTRLLLAGASNYGLSDPGICTAISLSQITTNLLTQKATMDHLIICRIVSRILEETEGAFLEAGHILDEEISKDS